MKTNFGVKARGGRRRAAVAAVLLGLAALAPACAHEEARPAGAGPLVTPPVAEIPPADALPGTFTVRQKLKATSDKGGGSFEAVLQKRPGKLTLVGITPYGSRAFLLEQTGSDVQFTSYVPRDLPFPPNFVLLDIHRVLDTWLGAPPAGGQGERSDRKMGEQIHERWQGGRLVERTFTRVSANPPGTITVTYQGDGPSGLPAHVKLVNARLGYEITIDTVAAQ